MRTGSWAVPQDLLLLQLDTIQVHTSICEAVRESPVEILDSYNSYLPGYMHLGLYLAVMPVVLVGGYDKLGW